MSKKRTILITGATGFLGSQILKEVLQSEDTRPIVLARPKKGQKVEDRVAGVIKYFFSDQEYSQAMARIRVVQGAVDEKKLGLYKETWKRLVDEVDEIYHSAAIAEFRVPLNEIRRVNVNGVRELMDFAAICKKSGRLKKINHVSTAYVAGTIRGVFKESDLNRAQGFNNTYEQSKFEAETLIEEYRKDGLDVTVFRPSILTGDSVSGKTSNFKMLYQPLRFFSEELFTIIPADRNACENLIPVDVVAKEIVMIANDPDSRGQTYNITNPNTVKAGHFIDVASDFFGFRKPEMVPLKEFDMNLLTHVQRILIEPFIPYFDYNPTFDTARSTEILAKYGYSCPALDDNMLIRLFRYCYDFGFIKRKRENVAAE